MPRQRRHLPLFRRRLCLSFRRPFILSSLLRRRSPRSRASFGCFGHSFREGQPRKPKSDEQEISQQRKGKEREGKGGLASFQKDGSALLTSRLRTALQRFSVGTLRWRRQRSSSCSPFSSFGNLNCPSSLSIIPLWVRFALRKNTFTLLVIGFLTTIYDRIPFSVGFPTFSSVCLSVCFCLLIFFLKIFVCFLLCFSSFCVFYDCGFGYVSFVC